MTARSELWNKSPELALLVDAISEAGIGSSTITAIIGALNTAAASGAVTDTDLMMAYVKQLVTAIQLIPTTAMRGTDSAYLAANGARIRQYKDIWCTAQTNTIVITTAGADIVFPNVVVAAAGSARGLPTGVTITEAFLLLMFDILDTSAAANYIKTAADTISIKISTDANFGLGVTAWTSVVGDWYTPASGMSSQVIIGSTDIAAELTATGAGTYNIQSDETTNTKGLESQGATMVLKNLRSGLRIYYSL